MPTLDLGCGGQKRGDVGVDIARWPGVDHVVQLGFEPLPFPDNHFERAYCIHAIEHIPFMVWTLSPNSTAGYHQWVRHYPMVDFLLEVWRVLKPGAEFEILTIAMNQPNGFWDPRAFQDPTHCSFWTTDTIRHFCGGRDSSAGDKNDVAAGLRVPFQIVQNGWNSDNLLSIVLRK